MNSLSRNCLTNLSYAKKILDDVDESRFADRPVGLNPPAWLLLHLATAADYAANLLGGNPVCPANWNEMADTKKPVSSSLDDYPPPGELKKYLGLSYENVSQLLERATPEQLNAPQKLGFYEEELPTVSDIVGFLMVSHFAIHLGQLSAWRRAIGRPPIF